MFNPAQLIPGEGLKRFERYKTQEGKSNLDIRYTLNTLTLATVQEYLDAGDNATARQILIDRRALIGKASAYQTYMDACDAAQDDSARTDASHPDEEAALAMLHADLLAQYSWLTQPLADCRIDLDGDGMDEIIIRRWKNASPARMPTRFWRMELQKSRITGRRVDVGVDLLICIGMRLSSALVCPQGIVYMLLITAEGGLPLSRRDERLPVCAPAAPSRSESPHAAAHSRSEPGQHIFWGKIF